MALVEQDAVKRPDPPLIANMYERWTLDCIIELAQVIAMDFVSRPRQYRLVPPHISAILQNFRFLTGTDPHFPNRVQRSMTFAAMLGSSDGMGVGTEPKSSARWQRWQEQGREPE
jgi:hypothetical protein